MMDLPYAARLAILPMAVKALPILIGLLVATVGLTVALRIFGPAGAQTVAIGEATGRVRTLVLRSLGFIFLFVLVAANLAAFTAQREFEAFRAEEGKARERTR